MSDYHPSIESVWGATPLGKLCGAQPANHCRPARARRTDPATSHEAGQSVADFEGDHYAQILDALSIGPAGATAIASRCGLGRDAVGKRMSELERRGIVVVDGTERNANGRNESRYRRVTNGR